MPFPDDIKDRLVAQGVGVYNTDIFISSKAAIPVGAGPFLSLIETGGSGSSKTQNDTATEHVTMQLVSRASTVAAARLMLRNAYNALGGANGLYNITINSTKYLSITSRQGSPTDIGLDDTGPNGRVMFSFNIDAEKQPS